MYRTIFFFILLLLSRALAVPPPGIVNTQGRVSVNGTNYGSPVPQTGHFKAALVNNGATETCWTNDGTNTGTPGGEPATAVPVTVTNGHYSFGLGDTALVNMTSTIPASVFEDNADVCLRLWFDTTATGPFELLAPDRCFTSSAFSFHAAKAEGVIDGGIASAMLAAKSVTSNALAIGSVTSSRIAGDSITTDKIADGSVTASDLSAGAVTSQEIMDGSITTDDLDHGSIGAWDVTPAGIFRGSGLVGIGTNAPAKLLHVEGEALITGALEVDQLQGLHFGAGGERIFWGADRFFTTDGMVIQGPIRTGSIAGVNFEYNDFSNIIEMPGSTEMGGVSDLHVGQDLEVGSDLYLSGLLTMNTEESDQFVYFYENGSLTGESLKWDDGSDRFEFSENVSISSGGGTSQLRLEQTSASNFARLELATTDGGLWQIAAESGATGDLRFYNGSRNRMILEDNGDLFIDGSLNPPSDRNVKAAFRDIDPGEVLDKVCRLPIQTWHYKEQSADIRHIGPVAQDFHAAFGLGVDDRHIATVDADGVAFAAIQALKAENNALRKRLEQLEQLVQARLSPVSDK